MNRLLRDKPVIENGNKVELSTLMSSSIHDMKNSLSIILNTINMLSESNNFSDNNRNSLDLLLQEGNKLNNNFIQLLSLYRIENKQYHANIDNHNVYDCLEEIALENEGLLTQHNIDLSIDCDEGLDWFIDRALILGTLNTIVNNACRYANKHITLSAHTRDAHLVISIMDDGEGYPEEMLNNDETQQCAIDFHSGNTGLGLYFASVVAELHQNKNKIGHIEISNTGIESGGKLSIHLP